MQLTKTHKARFICSNRGYYNTKIALNIVLKQSNLTINEFINKIKTS